MPRKKSLKAKRDDLCAFCSKDDDHPFLGKLLEASGMKLHSNCIFAASGLSQEKEDGRTDGEYIEGFHVSAIQNELKRGRRLCCIHCRYSGATVGCVVGSCPRSFHLPCITKAHGITIFEDPFPTYCKRHVTRQDLEPWFQMNDETPSCCICLFSILPENTPRKPITKVHQKCKTPVLPPPPTTVVTTDRIRRPPRRSCVTVSTPKCVQVSNGLSTNGSSTWELPDSPPRQNESEDSALGSSHSHKTSNTLPYTLPDWLLDYLNKVPPRTRTATYESWQHNTVHGLCCPKAWMHRSCIAGFAVSAALHYIKCPYCANRQTFIRSIIAAGIWVPDRDAAWELEPGAFAELAPVEERAEDDASSSSSDSDSSTQRSSSGDRSPHRSESSSASIENTHHPEPVARPVRSASVRARTPAVQPRPSSQRVIRPKEQPKPVLSLVWSTPNPNPNPRGRPASRTKARRFTHQTIFDHPKSPPHLVSHRGRGRGRRLSLFPRANSMLDSHIESRLRQATLGSFLASFRLTSPPE